MRPINLIVVHCSATRPDMDVDAAEIRRWHKAQGWTDIGYHFVIKRDGSVHTGRPLDRQGAHVSGYNHISVGICMVGGVTEHDVNVPEENFTPAQYASLKTLLTKLRPSYPHARILGHRDIPNVKKACPSFDVPKWATAVGLG